LDDRIFSPAGGIIQGLLPTSEADAFVPPALPHDSDFDGDIDLIDFASFQLCFTGPGVAVLPSACEPFDADEDHDVDLSDFGTFQLSFTGPF
jgi:hypothetical protein